MNFNRQKNDHQKPVHQHQRRSIAEGMARTGIIYVQLEEKKKKLGYIAHHFKWLISMHSSCSYVKIDIKERKVGALCL
jgi:hypothetical protein